MLGRKDYTQAEFDHAKEAIDQQLAAYKKLVKATDGAADPTVAAAQDAFEPLFFNNLTLALDRFFVHRIRPVTGKDINPLNEVELICESLMNNDGVLTANKVIKFVPEQSVLKLQLGDRIRLSAAQFERLSKAFFTEIKARFM